MFSNFGLRGEDSCGVFAQLLVFLPDCREMQGILRKKMSEQISLCDFCEKDSGFYVFFSHFGWNKMLKICEK